MSNLVSIVIPSYKQAHFLPEAIESCLAQTYPHIEIIVVDDGSPDDVKAVTDRYTDQSVQYIRQENKGLSGARNTGAAHAKGAFLNFLDADDLLKPDFIARCMQVFEADPALMGVYTPWETLVTDPKWAITKKYAAVPPEGMLKQLLNGLAVAQMNGLLMRTEIYRRIGGFRPASAGKDDWLFWFTLYALKAPLYYIPEPLVVYRRHGENMSNDKLFMLRQGIAAWELVRELNIEGLNIDSYIAQIYETIAMMHWSNGKRGDARTAYRTALRHNPKRTPQILAKLFATYLLDRQRVARLLGR